MTRTIVRVVGARPQFMQTPLVRNALIGAGFRHVLVHTGQHYDDMMSDAFFRDLGLPAPDVNLGVGSHSQGAATGRMMEGIEEALVSLKPDGLLVDGDTNSTLAAALAGVKLHIPVFHIEAGVRDFDRRRPEEINRLVSDHVSTLNFTPIPRASENLRREGRGETVRETGDVLLDCFLRYHERARSDIVGRLGLAAGCYCVMTLHRPENTDLAELARFSDIMTAVCELDQPIVFPVHPRTLPVFEAWRRGRGDIGPILAIDPVSYLDMLGLIDGCSMALTDSGGLPREAAWSGKRVVMLFRMDTWHDLLERGWAQIGKTDAQSVRDAIARARPAPAEARAFFGGGEAAAKIAAAIVRHFET